MNNLHLLYIKHFSRYGCRSTRLIPLSQVDQYLGLAGQIRNWAGFDFSGGLDRSARMTVAVLRRRGSRRTVGTPLRGLSRPTISH